MIAACGRRCDHDVAPGTDFAAVAAFLRPMNAHMPGTSTRSPIKGILFALGGALILSVNDVAIKSLSGKYALHQVILTRAFISMALI
ncbi:MAG TPA: hypothetical protein PLH39_05030, partial [Promineifilum sp.]|nr:hypothetical protein [Promineifilum sp.]